MSISSGQFTEHTDKYLGCVCGFEGLVEVTIDPESYPGQMVWCCPNCRRDMAEDMTPTTMSGAYWQIVTIDGGFLYGTYATGASARETLSMLNRDYPSREYQIVARKWNES